jgi:hypothetical protein
MDISSVTSQANIGGILAGHRKKVELILCARAKPLMGTCEVGIKGLTGIPGWGSSFAEVPLWSD